MKFGEQGGFDSLDFGADGAQTLVDPLSVFSQALVDPLFIFSQALVDPLFVFSQALVKPLFVIFAEHYFFDPFLPLAILSGLVWIQLRRARRIENPPHAASLPHKKLAMRSLPRAPGRSSRTPRSGPPLARDSRTNWQY